MKLLFVHAHFDDFEFTAAGTFELWGRRDGSHVARRILVCTDGGAGHHRMSREETARRRLGEQEAAARLGGFEFRLLADRAGTPYREGRLHASVDFIPSLWKAIRDFEPDYLFCPPIPEDPLAGVHVDHLDVAQAVRAVAYLINVPQAFTPEYPASPGPHRFLRTPVILNTYDGYMAGGHGHDLAVEIGPVADRVADLAWCHESQLLEWLPWIDRHHLQTPPDREAWRSQFRSLLDRRRKGLGIGVDGLFEVFRVSAWGVVPTLAQLVADFPGLAPAACDLDGLGRRLALWKAASGE